MKNKTIIIWTILFIIIVVALYLYLNTTKNEQREEIKENVIANNFVENKIADEIVDKNDSKIEIGKEEYREFTLNNIYHSDYNGDIHFNLYIPSSYTGEVTYSLYVTLPGWQGLYFQGLGENIKTEDFAFEAQKYNEKMIIIAPQLDDWEENSANQTIDLTEYIINNYNIDKIYLNGYSGGGETGSIVMGKRPDLFTAYLHCSSQWDGNYEILAKEKTPVYMVIGENDEYYGSSKTKTTYQTLYELYEKQGLSKEEIDKILILDIKPKEYFSSRNISNQHAGGSLLFSHDEEIMGWLFSKGR